MFFRISNCALTERMALTELLAGLAEKSTVRDLVTGDCCTAPRFACAGGMAWLPSAAVALQFCPEFVDNDMKAARVPKVGGLSCARHASAGPGAECGGETPLEMMKPDSQ